MHKQHVWGSATMALIDLIAILAYLVEIPQRSSAERPLGRLSPQDIRSRMRLLSRISLLPEAAGVFLHQDAITTREGHDGRLWSADYSDWSGEFTGRVQWDADTGELLFVSRKMGASRFSVPDLTRSEAIAHALRLLKQPGICLPNEGWLLRDSPRLYGRMWLINANSSERLASINIDKHLDQVTYLNIRHRRSLFSRRRGVWNARCDSSLQ
jgi:hypothetical protein